MQHPSASWHINLSESFQLKQCMLWTKRAHQCKIFRLLGALMMKVHPILHAIFETTMSGFLKFCVSYDYASTRFAKYLALMWPQNYTTFTLEHLSEFIKFVLVNMNQNKSQRSTISCFFLHLHMSIQILWYVQIFIYKN